MKSSCSCLWMTLAVAAGCTAATSDTSQTKYVAPSPCPDPEDPRVVYISDDAEQCRRIAFDCDGGTRFADECGCGCISAERTTAPMCPDPSDPRVLYISDDAEQCQRIAFDCDGGTRLADECGCGCISREGTAEADPVTCCRDLDYPHTVKDAECCADGVWRWFYRDDMRGNVCDPFGGQGQVCED